LDDVHSPICGAQSLYIGCI